MGCYGDSLEQWKDQQLQPVALEITTELNQHLSVAVSTNSDLHILQRYYLLDSI